MPPIEWVTKLIFSVVGIFLMAGMRCSSAIVGMFFNRDGYRTTFVW